MPIYDYFCIGCDKGFDVFKSIVQHQKQEPCPGCGNMAAQDLSRCRPQFIGTKIEDAEFNVGLGQITKSKRHRDELAKRMGVEEVGNEKPDKLHQHFDKTREEKLKKSWDEV